MAAAIAIALPTATSARTLTFEDLRKEVSVTSAHISPDGKSIAFLVSRSNFEKDKAENQLMLVDVASGVKRSLTQHRDDVNSPAWSPTGDRIAFIALSGDGDDADDQVYVMSMSGGDPIAITSAKNGVEQFVWSPDGTRIAFVAVDEKKPPKGTSKFDDGFPVGDNDFLARSAPKPAHIWIVSASGGDAHRLTSGTWSLPKGQFAAAIAWSADGKTIAFGMMPDAENSHFDRATINLVDVTAGHVRPLGANAGWSGGPLYSHDGSSIAYNVARHGSAFFQTDVAVAPATGGPSTDVTLALDRNVYPIGWMPGDKSIVVSGNDHTKTALWLQPLTGPATRIDLGSLSFSDGSVANDGGIAFTGQDGTHPPEVYYIGPGAASPKRLTDYNAEIAALDLGSTAPIDWKSSDGFDEDGVLTYPPHFDQAKKYPLVLMIHGGPISTSTETFDSNGNLPQIAAAHGWVVFEPNYRGSDNLGDALTQAIIGDVSSGPGRDVLEGVAAVEKLGFVDTTRIGVSGWSGGGLQTTWLVGHSHIWKAAVAGAAVTNWVDQYSLADISTDFAAAFFGGSPWDPKYAAAYRAESPITYARAVRTPTLILSDMGDYRVPVSQSFEFYHALRDNGVEAKFVAMPRGGHFPADPAGAENVLKLWIGWFEDHLK